MQETAQRAAGCERVSSLPASYFKSVEMETHKIRLQHTGPALRR
jgi:hypothetical protein